MNIKQLLSTTVLAFALSPLAAYAESDIAAKDHAWLDSLRTLQSTRTVAEVRAEIDPSVLYYGDHHPVDFQNAQSTLTREQVKNELAEFGTIRVGA
jgi:hypothetical protein